MPNAIFAVIRAPGPAWNEELAMRAQAGWDNHARFMDDLTSAGFIWMAGPLTDSREILLIVSAENEQQVRQTFQRDPWEPAGILATQTVRPWTVLLTAQSS